MKVPIEKLEKEGFVSKEEIGFDQVSKHLNRAHKDLKVADAIFEIDSEASYNYAYLAMLRAGRALMFSFGYRPVGGQQHKTVVLFSEAVLERKFSKLIAAFDKMRKFRNRFTYDEPELLVSEMGTKNAIKYAGKFVREVSVFIQKENPQYKLL